MTAGALPAGYVPFTADGADGACLVAAAPAVARALADARTLYAYAAAHPARQEFRGRAPAYAAPLPMGAGTVVVRHAWHGGLLRRLTRDLYAPPTRAPAELRVSEWLRAAGVRTPRVVAYARYPAPLGLRRADVATALVPGGRDLAAVLRAAPDDPAACALRAGWVAATAELLAQLARLGVRHPDLNLKNVLLAPDATGRPRAWALDVDVVRPAPPAPPAAEVRSAHTANVARLLRSLAKWRRQGLRAGADEVDALVARAAEALRDRPAPAGAGGHPA